MDIEAMRSIRASVLSLKTPLLAKGMSKDVIAAGENSKITLHCYSTGMGEKHGLHAHVEEEHMFVVLSGIAQFSDIGGRLPPVGKNEAIWLPKGCFYEFINSGSEPLVVLRFGACQEGADQSARVDPDGKEILGRSRQFPDLARPEVMAGAFFE